MTSKLDRRSLFSLGLAGAGILAAGASRGAIVQQLTASRLTQPGDRIYQPPTTLQAAADLYRRMSAPIRVNHEGPFAFVVDTGANQSVISAELAERLKLVVGPDEPLNGVAGVKLAPTTTARLSVDRREMDETTLSILPGQAIGGAGMLGLDQLGDQEFTLDFHNETLEIRAPGKLWRQPGTVVVKATRRDGQLTFINAQLAGTKVTAFLDTGAQNTIGNMQLRGMAMSLHPTAEWTKSQVVSATGQTLWADMAMLPDLKFGGMSFPDWPVAFADLHT
ncbi:MAG: retroviral-like aspartic protease family protein, partial [Caulobacteraceae bacterium]